MHLNVKVQNGKYFGGDSKISNILFECLIFLIFLWDEW